ncbi:MAG: TIR domain-containing protein [Ruminococcaceae bacterium]|nr:TIR domain-containing protein [Oscillospiraceae bacterium]
MSVLKCKICGGSLEFDRDASVCVCQYCGTKQTLPKLSGEHSSALYQRADHFRRNNDFDKAISIYEQILNENSTDAEAYWSLVLCRYGIEYVEDPKSNKRIATVNRMQYTSVLADEDYKAAIKYAEPEQRAIYEAEAKEIDTIQKGILAISQKEEPFDVFICYKETDNNGRRTQDSVLANDLYHQLDNEGYKVFFSRITLEDKLGSAYEPYIFAALNSAKVMVVIGTKPEYFNAVWVRNEWSRFLTLIKNGANKVLIPAYRDMDPYDLPEEFSHLQAQDMSKLGFMQDLIRGIEKLTGVSKPKFVQEQPVVQNAANTAPLLRRVYLFLEDGDWSSANEYCEKVLDLDPECGEAYLGKLMVALKIRRRERLSEQAEPFDQNPHYQKALRFGDEKLQRELKGAIQAIAQRAEETRLLGIYKQAEEILSTAQTKDDFVSAAKIFASISDFKDAKAKAKECEDKANEVYFSGLYASAMALMQAAKTSEDFLKAGEAFGKIKPYRDSEKLAAECVEQADYVTKNAIYTEAVALMVGNKISNYKKAISRFEKIPGFMDSAERIGYCQHKIEEITAITRASDLEKQNRAEARAEALKAKLPLIKKVAFVVVPLLIIAILAAILLPKLIAPSGSDISVESSPTVPSTTPITEPSEPQTVKFEYTVSDDGTAEITGITAQVKNLVIPGEIDGYKVTSIGYEAFYECTSLNSVTIPQGVTRIGDCAFYECHSLQSITIPEGVTSIGNSTFYGCTSLQSVTIPESVTSIGNQAFDGCSFLQSVTIPKSVASIDARAFYECYNLTDVWYAGSESDRASIEIGANNNELKNAAWHYGETSEPVTPPPEPIKPQDPNYEYKVLSNGTAEITDYEGSATNVTIPSTIGGYKVTRIGDYAFSYCDKLQSVTIPKGVISIGQSTFHGCTSLQSVTLPEGITSIGDSAFDHCYDLQSVTIPESVTSIGNRAFQFCRSLQSVTIPEGVTSIGQSTFHGCTSLQSVTLPEGVTNITESAFAECSSLKSVTIPKSVTSIGESAFWSCTTLTDVWYAGSESDRASIEIGTNNDKFKNATWHYGKTTPNSDYEYKVLSNGTAEITLYKGTATNITVPSTINGYKVTSIGGLTFQNCTSLQSIIIPEGVTNIGQFTFHGCTSLQSVVLPESITQIKDSTFDGLASLRSVTIPKTVVSIGERAFRNCTSLQSVTIPGSVATIDYSAFSGCTALSSVTIQNGVENIRSNAFSGCDSLTTVFIPGSVKTIGDNAFSSCDFLRSINIPESVTSIGYGAFGYCPALQSITIPGSVASIDKSTFIYCTALQSVTILEGIKSIGESAFYGCSSLQSVTIPGSVVTIGKSAFYGCSNLSSLIIKEGVTTIDYFAFGYCSLTSVTIPKSVESIGDNAFTADGAGGKITDVWYGGSESDRGKIVIGYNNRNLDNATWHYNS